MAAKPEPKPISIVCTVCGLDWAKHGPKPTTDKCIELLKSELASARSRQWFSNYAGSTGGASFTVIPPGPVV